MFSWLLVALTIPCAEPFALVHDNFNNTVRCVELSDSSFEEAVEALDDYCDQYPGAAGGMYPSSSFGGACELSYSCGVYVVETPCS